MSEKLKVPVETVVEAEKRTKEQLEADKKIEIAEGLRLRKDKEKLLSKLDKDKKLAFLKSMVERDLIAISTAEAIADGGELDASEIEEIFEKIDEIEETHDIDRILPADLRITKDEYLLALKDKPARQESLSKIDAALVHIYQSANPNPLSVLNFFGGFMAALDKNLVLVQENTIDIKRSLIARG